MKLSKKIILECLLLSLAILFSSCSVFNEVIGEKKPANNNEKLSEQQQVNSNVSQLEETLKNQESQAKTAKNDCNTKLSLSNRSGRNANDPASNTYQQCEQAKKLEEQVAEARKNLDSEKEKQKQIKEANDALNKDEGGKKETSGLLISLLIGVAGVLGLGILLGGLYLLLSKKIDKAIAAERTLTQQNSDRIKAKHDKLFAEHGKVMNDLERLVKLQQGKIEVLEFKAKEKGTGFGGQMPPQPPAEQAQYIKPEPQFPVSVENYLNKFRQQGQRASADTIGGLLIQDPSKNEEFMIIKDSSLDNELYYAVPSFARFPTKSEYFTYYQNYYNCENPSGGAVWIISPTVVRRVDDGWQLQQKGELEVR